MRITGSFTDTSNELRVLAETPRDKIILDLFSNGRQGGTAKVTADADGNLILVALEVKE